MKITVVLSLLLLFTTVVRAEPVANDADTVFALAERFVDAIAHDDIDAAGSCWISFEKLKDFIANSPAGVDVSNIDADNLAHMKKEWEKRHKQIESRLRTLINGLKRRQLVLSKIRLAKAMSERRSTENGFTGVQQIEIIMTIDDIKIEYELGGAGKYGKRWYLNEHPGSGATLIRDNRAETIRLEKPLK